MPSDRVDLILEQWKAVRPDLDCSSMGIIGRLRRTSNAWKSRMDKIFKQHGLTSIEFDILATMRRSDPTGVTPTKLYKTLMISSGAVSTRIEQLVKEGLVERISSEHDRRSCKVTLTAKGIELVDTALNAHVKNMDNMLSALTASEQKQLTSLLRKIMLDEEGQTS
ncbi:MarR family transcriptional regulator [Vibrio tubiashii]|nr:MarR family transcriptional regulator [Vibrio tubiashii]